MTPEGMVHALDEIQLLLKPHGCLIDIHPFGDPSLVEVYQQGRLLFSQPDPASSIADYRHADEALTQAVQRRIFTLEKAGQFDYLVYGSSVAELSVYYEEIDAFASSTENEAEDALEAEIFARAGEILQGAGEGAEVASHDRVHIARLKPIK